MSVSSVRNINWHMFIAQKIPKLNLLITTKKAPFFKKAFCQTHKLKIKLLVLFFAVMVSNHKFI
jgi:hypothetical protein